VAAICVAGAARFEAILGSIGFAAGTLVTAGVLTRGVIGAVGAKGRKAAGAGIIATEATSSVPRKSLTRVSTN
jgi:hypothetical protein